MAFKRSSVRSRPAPPEKIQDSVRLPSYCLTVSFFQKHDFVRIVSFIPANSVGISDKLRDLGRKIVSGCTAHAIILDRGACGGICSTSR